MNVEEECGSNSDIANDNPSPLLPWKDDDDVTPVLHPVPGGCAFKTQGTSWFSVFESGGCSTGDFRGSLCAPATEEQREQFVQLLFGELTIKPSFRAFDPPPYYL